MMQYDFTVWSQRVKHGMSPCGSGCRSVVADGCGRRAKMNAAHAVMRRIPTAARLPRFGCLSFVGYVRPRRGCLALKRHCGRFLNVRVQRHVRPLVVVPPYEPRHGIRLDVWRVDGARARLSCHVVEQAELALHLPVHPLQLVVGLGVGNPGQYVPYAQVVQALLEL